MILCTANIELEVELCNGNDHVNGNVNFNVTGVLFVFRMVTVTGDVTGMVYCDMLYIT
jgi:hypothetical protein